MADKYKGKDLLLAVKQMDCDKLSDFAIKNKSKKSPVSFKVMMGELSEQEIQEMWEELGRVVEERTHTLLLPLPTSNRQLHQDICLFLQAAIDLGIAYFELNEQNGGPTCTGLLSVVVHLNSKMLDLPSNLEGLKNCIALLCEKMFHSKLLYQDHVCYNTLVYILKRSLMPRAAKKEVKRVYALRSLIPKVISSGEVLDLMKKVVASPLYASMLEGQKVIKVALTADVDHVADIHEAIKQRLQSCTLTQASAYGKIYYHSWVYAVKNDLLDLKTELEMTCIQNIILLAIQERQKQFVTNLRKILMCFHSQKKELYVSKMLYFIYQPILWRYIKHPDGVVRANSSQLFLDVFPLEDPEVQIVTTDQELNDQMLMIKSLLTDDFPIVRSTTVIGLCIAMSINWELFPEEMLKTYFRIIINELSCDSSSSDVRCAVAKGLKVLLENPLTLPTMEELLPKVHHLFHDISEGVRVAFAQLLLRVKRIAAIKYYRIVPLEHLLARLEEDAALAKPLVSLLHNSYFPPQEPPSSWLHRCVEMVKANRGASRVFFQHVSQHIGLEATAKFMKCTVESIHFYVSSKVSTKKLQILSSGSDPSSPEETLGFHDPEVVSGMLDSVAILWLANITILEKPDNKHYLKMIVSKLTKCLGDLSLYYKDTPVWQSVYYLCSFMPSVPSLASLCFVRLKALPKDAPQEDFLTLLECLCGQEAPSLLTLLQDWTREGLLLLTPLTPPAPKRRKKEEVKKIEEPEVLLGRPLLALRLLGAALDRRSCQKALLVTNPGKLKEMLHFMDDIKRIVELPTEKRGKEEGSFLRGLHMLLLKIAVLLRGEEQFSVVKFVEDLISWLQLKVLRPFSINSSARRSSGGGPRCCPQLVRDICEDMCTVMADMTLLGFLNLKSLKFLKFALNLLQLECGGSLLLPVCSLLFKHVTYGLYLGLDSRGKEFEILKIVPDCYTKVIQHLCKGDFFASIPQADMKDCQALLSTSLQQLQEGKVEELVSSTITSLLRGILSSTEHCEEKKFNSFEDLSISAPGTILLSIVCAKPKMIVYFLQQLQIYVAKPEMDTQSWVTCFAIVHAIQKYKRCTKAVSHELLFLLEKMERGLNSPLKKVDLNIPHEDPKGGKASSMELCFEEHCLNECNKLKDCLLQKAVT